MNLYQAVLITENSASRVDLELDTKGVSTMRGKSRIVRSFVRALLLTLFVAAMAYAGPAVVGMVAGSTHASVGGKTVLPNTTLFSGDGLQVNEGLAVVALGSTSRMIFGRDTAAFFRRDSDEVTVFLGQGVVSLSHAEDLMSVRVKVGDVSVIPVSGFKTLGEVAIGDGEVTVTAKDGELRVVENGQAIVVAKGETITVSAKASAPQSTGKATVPKLPLLPPQTEPSSSSKEIPEAAPSGGVLTIPPIGLAQDGSAATNPSWRAPNAIVGASSAPAKAVASAGAIGYALNTPADFTPKNSEYKPGP